MSPPSQRRVLRHLLLRNCDSGPAAFRFCITVGTCLGGLAQRGSAQDSIPVLSLSNPVAGVMEKQTPAYALNLRTGQFLRLDGRAEGWAGLRLIGPRGDTLQLTNGLGPVDTSGALIATRPINSWHWAALSQVVRTSGLHRLEIVRYDDDTVSMRYELKVNELLSPARYAARQDSLRGDPRVAWLREHAIRVRSLSPDDNDFADLGPLREQIGAARIVLLGEESHASGTNILAMSRLVRFLHREMGFDVVAFESPLYPMWKVWQLLQAGHEPGDAIRQGLVGTWSRAAAFQPLARYLGEHARSAHPLEVAGVDVQLVGAPSRQGLVTELREAVARERLGVEGRHFVAGFWSTLSRFVAVDAYWASQPDSIPGRRLQEDALSGLRWLAERFTDASEARPAGEGRTLKMWGQVSRSLAELMAFTWSETRGETEGYDRRDRQMTQNLAWLAKEYYRGRKIIVWAANPHVIRYPYRLQTRGTPKPEPALPFGSGMGQGVWEVFGDRSFVIAATAGGGQFRWRASPPSWGPFAVVSDQDPAFEFEELLVATELEQAVLPLRNLTNSGTWLRSPILSRPWMYRSLLTTWPDHADAVLFLRTAAPRTSAPDRP